MLIKQNLVYFIFYRFSFRKQMKTHKSFQDSFCEWNTIRPLNIYLSTEISLYEFNWNKCWSLWHILITKSQVISLQMNFRQFSCRTIRRIAHLSVSQQFVIFGGCCFCKKKKNGSKSKKILLVFQQQLTDSVFFCICFI